MQCTRRGENETQNERDREPSSFPKVLGSSKIEEEEKAWSYRSNVMETVTLICFLQLLLYGTIADSKYMTKILLFIPCMVPMDLN